MKRILLVLCLILAGVAMAQVPVYDIRVPDSMMVKSIQRINLNAVVDSAHRYALGEFVKASDFDRLNGMYTKLLEMDSKHLTESIQMLEPDLIRAWQIVNDTSLVIMKKSSIPKHK